MREREGIVQRREEEVLRQVQRVQPRHDAWHDAGDRADEAIVDDDEARDDRSRWLCREGARAVKPFIAATLCMVVVAACAMGGAKRSAAPAAMTSQQPPTMAGGSPDMASPKAQLDDLYARVEQERQSMQLPEPQVESGTPATPMATEPMPTSATDKTCKPAPSETCTNSCKLSDSICSNTDKICKIAGELAGDQDAADKCTKATKTCKTSHEKCCSCT